MKLQYSRKNTMQIVICFLLFTLSNITSAELVKWEASGHLTDVNTSGGFITRFPEATIGTPFLITFTFDSSTALSSTTQGESGNRYRYNDAIYSVLLSIGTRTQYFSSSVSNSIDIWNNFTFLGLTDPPSDGFNLIMDYSSLGRFRQFGIILRGPEYLDLYSGPGLPIQPSSLLNQLSTRVFQLIDESDSIIGTIDNVKFFSGPIITQSFPTLELSPTDSGIVNIIISNSSVASEAMIDPITGWGLNRGTLIGQIFSDGEPHIDGDLYPNPYRIDIQLSSMRDAFNGSSIYPGESVTLPFAILTPLYGPVPAGSYSSVMRLSMSGYEVGINQFTVNVLEQDSFSIIFPIDGSTAYTHDVTSIMDNAGMPNKEDGVIEAFDGTKAFCMDGSYFEPFKKSDVQVSCDNLDGTAKGGIYNYRVCLDSNREYDHLGFPITPCLNPNYDSLLNSIRYRETLDKDEWPHVSYDGHSGYDYPQNRDAKWNPIQTDIVAPARGILCLATTANNPSDSAEWRTEANAPDGDPLCPYSEDSINGNNRSTDPWNGYHTFYIVHDNGMSTWFLHAGSGNVFTDKFNDCMDKDKDTLKCSKKVTKDKINSKVEAALEGQIAYEILLNGYAEVEEGQVIGYVGDWGSEGARHLHFEVREKDGETLKDPYKEPAMWRD